jgi:hypothetical protein
MRLLVLVVEDSDLVDDCLSAVVELDVAGVQVVHSSTVMEVLAREAPIFAGLRELITRPKAESRLILGVANRSVLAELDRLLQRIGIKLSEPGVGYALEVPLDGLIGQLEFDE